MQRLHQQFAFSPPLSMMGLMTRPKYHDRHPVCPPSAVKWFDNFMRPWVHKPARLFGPYVSRGMTVMDIGCGGGWATIGLAHLVGPEGRVIAADLEPLMLNRTKNRAYRAGVADRLTRHRTPPDRIGTDYRLDFANAFWMVHETPDQKAFLQELFELLVPGGHLFIAEPRVHVTLDDFATTLTTAVGLGFSLAARPKVFFSYAAVLRKP